MRILATEKLKAVLLCLVLTFGTTTNPDLVNLRALQRSYWVRRSTILHNQDPKYLMIYEQPEYFEVDFQGAW